MAPSTQIVRVDGLHHLPALTPAGAGMMVSRTLKNLPPIFGAHAGQSTAPVYVLLCALRRIGLHDTERLDAGDAVVDVARTFGVDRATLYRLRAEVGA
jgi:hypothetical protein